MCSLLFWENMIHYCYETTVKLFDEIFVYYGKHSDKSRINNYVGSGKFIQKIIKDRKILEIEDPNFEIKCQILCEFETEDLALEFENLLISEAIDCVSNCMNIAEGGFGGDTFTRQSEKRKREIIEKRILKTRGQKRSPDARRNIANSLKNYKHTDETKKRMSIGRSGELSYQYNCLPWMSNSIRNNKKFLNIWGKADKIYKVWKEDDSRTHAKIRKICIERKILLDEDPKLVRMISWFREGHDPSNYELPK